MLFLINVCIISCAVLITSHQPQLLVNGVRLCLLLLLSTKVVCVIFCYVILINKKTLVSYFYFVDYGKVWLDLLVSFIASHLMERKYVLG